MVSTFYFICGLVEVSIYHDKKSYINSYVHSTSYIRQFFYYYNNRSLSHKRGIECDLGSKNWSCIDSCENHPLQFSFNILLFFNMIFRNRTSQQRTYRPGIAGWNQNFGFLWEALGPNGWTPQLPLTGWSGPAGAVILSQKHLVRVSGLSASAWSAVLKDHIHKKKNRRSKSKVSLSIREKRAQAKMNAGLRAS